MDAPRARAPEGAWTRQRPRGSAPPAGRARANQARSARPEEPGPAVFGGVAPDLRQHGSFANPGVPGSRIGGVIVVWLHQASLASLSPASNAAWVTPCAIAVVNQVSS